MSNALKNHLVRTKQIVLSRKTIIETIDRILEDKKYSLERTKVPSKRRALQHTIEFYSAIKHHLNDKFPAEIFTYINPSLHLLHNGKSVNPQSKEHELLKTLFDKAD